MCLPCPASRYGNTSGLTASSCSGVCTANPGSICGLGEASPHGTPCEQGAYADVASNQCVLCPPGRYGDVEGAASSGCSGPCVSASGQYCGVGAMSATGSICPPGTYGVAGATECQLCPPGRYGAVFGLSSPGCSGPCTAAAGSYCPEGGVSHVGIVCLKGTYSNSTGAQSCTLCPAGQYSRRLGLTSLAGCASCSVGRYSLAGAAECTPCPAGTFGSTVGLSSPACSGVCNTSSSPGYYCPAGATTWLPRPCPDGKFSNVTTGATVCIQCPLGTQSVGPATQCTVCSPGQLLPVACCCCIAHPH
jgi:hypothetical protein